MTSDSDSSAASSVSASKDVSKHKKHGKHDSASTTTATKTPLDVEAAAPLVQPGHDDDDDDKTVEGVEIFDEELPNGFCARISRSKRRLAAVLGGALCVLVTLSVLGREASLVLKSAE